MTERVHKRVMHALALAADEVELVEHYLIEAGKDDLETTIPAPIVLHEIAYLLRELSKTVSKIEVLRE